MTPRSARSCFAEPADIYIVNHHGLAVIAKEVMARLDIDVICFDEAAAYRNSRTALCKDSIPHRRPTRGGVGHDRFPYSSARQPIAIGFGALSRA